MMSPNPMPSRNRLLALEQELQSRRPTGDRQQQKRRKASLTAGEPTATASVNPASIPSPPPGRQKNRQRPASPAETTPPMSPWQVLAARLTHNQPTRYVPPAPDIDWSPSRSISEQPTSSRRRAAAPSPQQLLPNLPTRSQPTPNESLHAIASSQIVSQLSEDEQAGNDVEDETPLTSWQDLANQIQQARSPLQRQSRTLQARSQPLALSSSVISVKPLIHSLNSSDQENTTNSVLPRKLSSFVQSSAPVTEPLETSAIVPSNATTETAIVRLTSGEIEGALVPLSQADRGILTRYFPNTTRSLRAICRSQQLQRAIPLLAGFVLPCVLSKTQFLPATLGSQVPSTGDSLCVLPKTDSRN